jgi:pilus assembly protein FimV
MTGSQRRWILRRLILIIISLCLVPWHVLALGLGQIEVLSKLNQPLQAQIPIMLSPDERSSEITSQLANEIEFAKQHIPYAGVLTYLQFKIVENKEQSYIQITTTQNITEPALHFLLQVDSPSGRLINAYTILLDPSNDNALNAETYGAVQKNEQLWDIAAKLKPKQDVTLSQTVAALFLKNPQAFVHANLNGLKVGKQLLIPTDAEIKAISQEQALAILNEHRRAWNAKVKEPQEMTGNIKVVSNSIQPVQSVGPSDTLIYPSADKPALPSATVANIIHEDSPSQDVSVQQLLHDSQQNLAKTNQAYAELKQADSQLIAQLQNLKLKQESLIQELQTKNHELQLKNDELAALRVRVAELVNKTVAAVPEQSHTNWAKPLLIWLIILVLSAGVIAYLIKTQRLKLAELSLAKRFTDFLTTLRVRFAQTEAKLETDDQPMVKDEISELTQTRENRLEKSVESAPQVTRETSPIEPLEEAGIYFVYGRYEQAQKVLLTALEISPDRADLKQKLLEVYAARGDRASFEHFANQMRNSAMAENPEFWQDVHELHRKTWPEQYDKALVEVAEKTASESEVTAQTQSVSAKDEKALAEIPEVTLEPSGQGIDLDELTEHIENEFIAAEEIILADEDVVATKLEMARSCMEIGAIEDAKKLLMDVQRMGDEAQRKEAERLLQRLS